MLIQDRIKMILKMHGMTAASFADKIGVQRSNISHVLSGRSKPGLDFLEKIIIQFPRVNAHWLLTGNMPTMLRELQEPELAENKVKTEMDGVHEEVEKIVIFYTNGTCKTYQSKK